MTPPPLDHVVFRAPGVTVGAFRCPIGHPRFEDSGPIENDIFVFPRRSVGIRHEGKQPFLADPSLVTLYNRGQRYSRHMVSPEGDACEWFAVDRRLLFDAIRSHDPCAAERPDRPFRHAYAPCPAGSYLRQRALFVALRAGVVVDPLEVVEAVLTLLDDVLASAERFWCRRATSRTQRSRCSEIAEEVRVWLAARLFEPLHLDDVAAALGVSPYHLCRSFRAATGETMHAYRNRMRLQQSLERVASDDDLTLLALDLGYSSHSHFTAAVGRLFGESPSAVRRRLGQRRARIPLDTTNTRPE